MNAAARSALVVDDDAFFRMALCTILTTKLGCSKVIEAASFDEALEQLSENANVSIALVDLSMPGIRTPANLRVIRENFPSILVVVVSASNSRSDVLKALDAGVHGYVPKDRALLRTPQRYLPNEAKMPRMLSEVIRCVG